MASYTVSLTASTATGTYVHDDLFGTNALHDVNVASGGDMAPDPAFEAAVDAMDLTGLRYPGGHAENTIDITRLENGGLRPEVRAFMDWCVENSTPEQMMQVTIVLPTKVDVPASQIEDFVYLLLRDYGDYVTGLEIGNEYSIGPRKDGFDRSTHPEDIAGSDFVSSMTETEYGIAANRVINAAQDAIDRLAADRPGLGHDPDILIQLGDPMGAGSDYKGNGNWDQANEAILAWLDQSALDAIDGAVGHYYYNKGHDDALAFDGEYQEVRSLDERIANFNDHLGREVPLHITEWNVLNSNTTQLGMAAPSVLLEMFEFMVQAETAEAFIWPLQHRTANTIAGNRDTGEMDLSPGGAAFAMMAETLRPETSADTGYLETFESIQTEWTGSGGAVETNLYSSRYHDVLYVSLRDLEPGTVTIDLQPFLAETASVEVTRLTMDRGSSDGLSDLADPDGMNRIARRSIDAAELEALSRLAFFDASDKNHIKETAGGGYLTYLPPAESIVPLVSNPQSITDYYFTAEIDVDPLLIDVEGDFLGRGEASLNLLPFDVAQIVIEKKWVQKGDGSDEVFTGGDGCDVVIARDGNDRVSTGGGDDTLKGGYGDDLLSAGSGDDSIVAGDGNDTILAGAGNDVIDAGTGTKIIHGGEGKDRVRLIETRDSYTATLEGGVLRLSGGGLDARLDGIELLEFDDVTVAVTEYLAGLGPLPTGQYGTAQDDRLTGTPDDELLGGNGGADVLIGHGGRDTLRGGDGDDLLIGEDRGFFGTEASGQIYRLFNAVFGREPNVDGHQHWIRMILSGEMSLSEMAAAFVGSREYQVRYGDTTDRDFITLLYRNVLNRDPAAKGLDAWAKALENGMSRQEVVERFAESVEHQNRTEVSQSRFDDVRDASSWADDVYRLFHAVLNRAPNPQGFDHCTDTLSNGMALADLVDAFMASPEFMNTYGDTSDAEFVTLLYQNVLKRPPAPAGLANWTSALEAGMTRAEAVMGFMGSAEFVGKTSSSLKSYMLALGSDDVLIGGSGDNILSGGLYSDTFVFNADDDGRNVVTDLEAWDRIELGNFGYADAGGALSHMTQQGDDVLFQDQGVTVVFSDIQLDALTADMFTLL